MLFLVTHYRGRCSLTFRACLETGFRVANLFPGRFAWEIAIWDDEWSRVLRSDVFASGRLICAVQCMLTRRHFLRIVDCGPPLSNKPPFFGRNSGHASPDDSHLTYPVISYITGAALAMKSREVPDITTVRRKERCGLSSER